MDNINFQATSVGYLKIVPKFKLDIISKINYLIQT